MNFYVYLYTQRHEMYVYIYTYPDNKKKWEEIKS